MAIELDLVDSTGSSAGLSTYTFPSLSLGAAAADRYIVVGIAKRSPGASPISAVTVRGVAAVEVNTRNIIGGGGYSLAALYIAAVPTGTSGDVVVAFSSSTNRCGVSVYRLRGIASAAPFSVDGGTSSGSALNIPAGGVAIAVSYVAHGNAGQRLTSASRAFVAAQEGHAWSWSKVSGGVQWTGLDEDVDIQIAIQQADVNSQTVAASWEPGASGAARQMMHYMRLHNG